MVHWRNSSSPTLCLCSLLLVYCNHNLESPPCFTCTRDLCMRLKRISYPINEIQNCDRVCKKCNERSCFNVFARSGVSTFVSGHAPEFILYRPRDTKHEELHAPLCFMIIDSNTWKMILERQVLSFKSIWNVFKFLKLSALRFIIKLYSFIICSPAILYGHRLKVIIIPAVPSLAFLCTRNTFGQCFMLTIKLVISHL